MASLGVSYDPQTTATALAQKYITPRQQVIDSQMAQANATTDGLSKLKTAMGSFLTSLGSLTGFGKSMFQQAATLSDTTLGSATASSTAAPGTYSFFVEQIATASQVSYDAVPDVPAAGGGILKVNLGGAPAFSVDLSSADTDNNGTMSVREVATAINKAAGNNSQVSAAVVTVGGVQQLMLTAKNTGANSQISLDTSGVGDAGLKTALSDPAKFKEIVQARDAKVWLGAQGTGTLAQQASNTFTNIDGVKVTFTKAQPAAAAPMTVTVGYDSTATTKNVQDFIDAYNKLKVVIDGLVDPGDPTKGKAGGPFAHDAGVRALRDQMVNLMRPVNSNNADSLAAYGIIGNKDGTLSLDSSRLSSTLAIDPAGLDKLIGSTTAASKSGISAALEKNIKAWNDITGGQLKGRQDQVDQVVKRLDRQQDSLNDQYDSTYKRYLVQFTNLQAIQNKMNSNMDLFDALFGNDKSS